MRAAPAFLASLGLALGAACGEPAPTPEPMEAATAPRALARIGPGPHDIAVLDMGGFGEIRIELLPELAPAWVDFFSGRVAAGGYDGTSFHRVIPGFMLQGGNPLSLDDDPRNDAKSGVEEVPDNEHSDYPHVRGTVSIANSGYGPASGSVQFFIVHQDARHLDGDYTVVGRVVDGMDVVDALAGMEIDTYGRYGPPDRPYPVDARIRRAWIEPASEALAASGGNG